MFVPFKDNLAYDQIPDMPVDGTVFLDCFSRPVQTPCSCLQTSFHSYPQDDEGLGRKRVNVQGSLVESS